MSGFEKIKEIDVNSLTEANLSYLIQVILGSSIWNSDIFSEEHSRIIWSIFVEIGQKNYSQDDTISKLSLLVPQPVAETLFHVYQKNEESMKEVLRSLRWDNPEVVDINWSVCKAKESTLLTRIAKPTASITLHAVSDGSSASEPFTFTCNLQQLQELHWNVKESMARLSDLKQMNK